MAEQGNKPRTPAGDEPTPPPHTDAASKASETPETAAPPMSAESASLLGLIDKLNALLEKSDLVELEVEAGHSGILLRKPAALLPPAAAPGAAAAGITGPTGAAPGEIVAPIPSARAVRAPLTGIFYSSSSPSAPTYVTVGQQVAVGQVIGLIEAMKLFNEIKSDISGKVIRIVAETGKLVKAKQPLIEVEP
jgi:acetyl-CoA carboxylase biotin carboxyl carrier protein